MVQTLADLQSLIQQATVSITDLDGKNVRIAFQGRNQPAHTIEQDIIYVSLKQISDDWGKYQEKIYDPDYEQEQTFYTRVMECTWFCYGPNSFEFADAIRIGIYYPDIRAPLNRENVKPLVQPPNPDRVPYVFDTQWWERSDLKINFNVGTLRTNTTPWISSAEVDIYDEDGLQRVANISE